MFALLEFCFILNIFKIVFYMNMDIFVLFFFALYFNGIFKCHLHTKC